METKVLIKWSDLADDTELKMTKKEFEDRLKGFSTNAVFKFTCDCADMAEANWCPSQVENLERLFNAVLKGEPYAEPFEEEKSK